MSKHAQLKQGEVAGEGVGKHVQLKPKVRSLRTTGKVHQYQ